MADWAWMKQGLCKDDGTLWFANHPQLQHMAKTVCWSCPVLEECVEYAVLKYDQQDGIIGGMDLEERRAERRRRGIRINPTRLDSL